MKSVSELNSSKESQNLTWGKNIEGNYSSLSKTIQLFELADYPVHPNQIITALPISFTLADVILISN